MPYSHLKWWRIGSVAVVAVVLLGFALNLADGSVNVWEVIVVVVIPLLQWATFWSPSSALVRNAERRRLQEGA